MLAGRASASKAHNIRVLRPNRSSDDEMVMMVMGFSRHGTRIPLAYRNRLLACALEWDVTGLFNTLRTTVFPNPAFYFLASSSSTLDPTTVNLHNQQLHEFLSLPYPITALVHIILCINNQCDGGNGVVVHGSLSQLLFHSNNNDRQ